MNNLRVLGSVLLGTTFAVLLHSVPRSGAGLRTVDGPVAPPQTAVLLLPPVDATVDAAKLAPLREQVVRLAMQYEFIARHFKVLGDKLASRAAAAAPVIDLSRPDPMDASELTNLAHRTGTRWVVRIVVLEITSDPESLKTFRARSTIRLQIWDAYESRWLLNGSRVGRTDEGGPPGWLFITSLGKAVNTALSDCLKTYPIVVNVSREGSIVDYLSGQTAPVVADPGFPFKGLKSPGSMPK